jgi:hypothetical protein
MITTGMTKTAEGTAEKTNTEIRELSAAELEQAAGGADKTGNWKYCINGTTAGGGPGLYPWYATCKE